MEEEFLREEPHLLWVYPSSEISSILLSLLRTSGAMVSCSFLVQLCLEHLFPPHKMTCIRSIPLILKKQIFKRTKFLSNSQLENQKQTRL